MLKILLLLIFGKRVRKPLEVDKCYRQARDLAFYKVTRIHKSGTYTAYGRNYAGIWVEDTVFGAIDDTQPLWYEVSEESFVREIKEECKSREYTSENIDTDGVIIGDDIDLDISNWYWDEGFNTLYTKSLGNGGVRIFRYGAFKKKK